MLLPPTDRDGTCHHAPAVVKRYLVTLGGMAVLTGCSIRTPRSAGTSCAIWCRRRLTFAAERARVATEGWGARLLALQGEDGQWAGGACVRKTTSTPPTRTVNPESPPPIVDIRSLSSAASLRLETRLQSGADVPHFLSGCEADRGWVTLRFTGEPKRAVGRIDRLPGQSLQCNRAPRPRA
jgi:hypothetical protein